MIDNHTIPKHHADVVYKTIDEETVLVLPATGKVTILNNVGSTIWELINGTNSIELIAEELCKQFTVDMGTALKDTFEFIELLKNKQLIIID